MRMPSQQAVPLNHAWPNQEARALVRKCDDQPTDTTATRNAVTNTVSTSMNMTVIPSSALDRL